MAKTIGVDICRALPGFHSFTGSDYTAAFLRKVKGRPYDVMVKSAKFTQTFGDLGRCDKVTIDTAVILKEIVCAMYGQTKLRCVNDARLAMFGKLYSPKHKEQPLERLKASDPSCLPPCKSVLDQTKWL